MFLKELLEGTTVAGDYPQADICDIVYDSRKARPGTAFVCMKGETTDGHKYAKAHMTSAAACSSRKRRSACPMMQLC